MRLARRAKTREGFRSEKYLAFGCENPVQINCRVSDALNLNSTDCVTSVIKFKGDLLASAGKECVSCFMEQAVIPKPLIIAEMRPRALLRMPLNHPVYQ
jgi:hypothetical protein